MGGRKAWKNGDEAIEYAKDVVLADFESEGDGDVISKLLKDFYNAEINVTEQEIANEMERLLPIAHKKISGGNK